MTAVIIMERTSGLSIRMSGVVSQATNINKRAKVTLSFMQIADLIMQTQNHNILTGI